MVLFMDMVTDHSVNEKRNLLMPLLGLLFLICSTEGKKEGRKEIFYLTTHSNTFLIWLYGISHIVKDNLYSKRGNDAATTWVILSS